MNEVSTTIINLGPSNIFNNFIYYDASVHFWAINFNPTSVFKDLFYYDASFTENHVTFFTTCAEAPKKKRLLLPITLISFFNLEQECLFRQTGTAASDPRNSCHLSASCHKSVGAYSVTSLHPRSNCYSIDFCHVIVGVVCGAGDFSHPSHSVTNVTGLLPASINSYCSYLRHFGEN